MATQTTKTIICLANSRKTSGRCVAGREVLAAGVGPWIRPHSSRPTHELSEDERRYQNGQDPRLLDVIAVPVVGPRPHAYQVENYLIDDQFYWGFIRQASKPEIQACLDSVSGALWGTGSSYNGTNDRIDEHAAGALGESLKLLEVKDLSIHVGIEGAEFGNAKRKVRGDFTLNSIHYLLAITDPLIEKQYLGGANGSYKVGRAALCVSLGDAFQGYAYKLIAGVILPPLIW